MIDYLNHVKNYLKLEFAIDSLVCQYTSFLQVPKEYTVVVFVQDVDPAILRTVDKTKAKVFLLNTEQLTVSTYANRVFAMINSFKLPIIDYSEENIEILKTKFPNITVFHFPFPIQFVNTEFVNKSVSVTTLLNSHRRKRLCRQLKVTDFQGMWGVERDTLIASSKILVNVHYAEDYNIFESIRCYHALEMGVLVVSEPSSANDKLLLHDFIFFCSPNDLAKKVKDIEENYDKYRERCFGTDGKKEIERRIKEVYQRELHSL